MLYFFLFSKIFFNFLYSAISESIHLIIVIGSSLNVSANSSAGDFVFIVIKLLLTPTPRLPLNFSLNAWLGYTVLTYLLLLKNAFANPAGVILLLVCLSNFPNASGCISLLF